MKEADIIKLLPVEDRAKLEEKSFPCGVSFLLLLVGLSLGLYYWLGDAFIFDYWTVSPFWGFVIFLGASIFLCLILSWIYSFYWEEYNKIIQEANKDIEEIIKKGDESPEVINRLRKESIERRIGKETLTKEDFLWHTSLYCWGCGKEHSQLTKSYTLKRERTESWKEGAVRYRKTFYKTSSINICPACYDRLMQSKQQEDKNSPWLLLSMAILCISIVVGAYYIWGENGIWGALLAFFFGGFYVIFWLGSLIVYPFLKHGDSSTRWSFDEIPEIRKFMKQNLPHTH